MNWNGFRNWAGPLHQGLGHWEGEPDATSCPCRVDQLCEVRGPERPPGEKTKKQKPCSLPQRAEKFFMRVGGSVGVVVNF